MTLQFNEQGLMPALAQDRFDGQVRMLAWMNREAIDRTLDTGLATFFSRSRGKLWVKGEGSGNVLRVHSLTADCDADTLLLLVEPAGPSCHTGRPACFFKRVGPGGSLVDEPFEVTPFLAELERTIRERQASSAEKSYTKSLLDGGVAKVNAKISEEAGELWRRSPTKVTNACSARPPTCSSMSWSACARGAWISHRWSERSPPARTRAGTPRKPAEKSPRR